MVTHHLDRAFPLFNAISGARFDSGTVEARAVKVITPYLERGLPFLVAVDSEWSRRGARAHARHQAWASRWSPCRACTSRWTAPSTHVCLEGVSIEPVGASRLDELLGVFLEGFETP